MRHFTDVSDALTWLRAQGAQRLQCDSRKIKPGDAFVAWPGFSTDGRAFVPAALEAGAVACLVEAEALNSIPLAASEDPRIASFKGLKPVTGDLAAAFYDHPSRQVDVVAITGTNGKTSTAWWLARAMAALGRRCALMGTLGVGLPGLAADPLSGLVPTGLTTPDPVAVQAAMRTWADMGVQACAMEASSIGIVEHRLAGTAVKVAMFTNFTQDHLDYHVSMDAYWAAKRALFAWPGLAAAVVNVDDPKGQTLADELTLTAGLDVWTVSLTDASARLHATECRVTAAGMHLAVAEGGQRMDLGVPLIGTYNAANLLGVLASLRALGVPLAAACEACHTLSAVPGRMEQVSCGLDHAQPMLPLVLVDYAHTPDALDKALSALAPITRARAGQLHCVVGCGGDRDATKRPLMAARSEAHADHLCLTSDNPRSEDPAHILAQMVSGLKLPAQVTVEPDRARAIASVVARAASADVVLIAGKGHETTQEIAGVKHPFSDVEHARRALMARLASTGVPA
jgi:UDP-N-acetylmuramoyl-L-alanyl-D-glutamate--2,6-diaminopimelate ligase